jgi:hypothetical protein
MHDDAATANRLVNAVVIYDAFQGIGAFPPNTSVFIAIPYTQFQHLAGMGADGRRCGEKRGREDTETDSPRLRVSL